MNPVKLRVLMFNVHAGQAIYVGALAWLLKRLPFIHIVLIQEAQKPKARRALFDQFPAKKWHRVGPNVTAGPLVGTYVLARKGRFVLQSDTNERLSEGLSGSHPQRNLVSAHLLDKQTSRTVDATSVHLWHIRGVDLEGASIFARGHVHQTREIAKHHHQLGDAGTVQLAGGDWNEDLDGRVYLKSARTIMLGKAGMIPAYQLTKHGSRTANLDDLFYKPEKYIKLCSRRRVGLPFAVVDHPAILVTFEITPA